MRVIFIILVLSPFFGLAQDSILVGYGPEDMALDTFFDRERLIISCNDWINDDVETETGFWTYDLKSEKVDRLKVVFPTKPFTIRPHGIHVANSMLFAINHSKKGDTIFGGKPEKKDGHQILKMRLMGDSAVLENIIGDELPNHVVGLRALWYVEPIDLNIVTPGCRQVNDHLLHVVQVIRTIGGRSRQACRCRGRIKDPRKVW